MILALCISLAGSASLCASRFSTVFLRRLMYIYIFALADLYVINRPYTFTLDILTNGKLIEKCARPQRQCK